MLGVVKSSVSPMEHVVCVYEFSCMYHVRYEWEEFGSEVVCGLAWQLSRQIVNGHQNYTITCNTDTTDTLYIIPAICIILTHSQRDTLYTIVMGT